MNAAALRVQRTYLALMLGNTLASSFIWGINTLFLLDAGLTNLEAFAANAFFTAGMVVFEIPTGIVADTWGRRTSYLIGTVTLSVATGAYWLLWRTHAPFWEWAFASMFLGLGFTFFSGAVEAWLTDALAFAKYDGELDDVLGRGQMVSGAAMLMGAVAGGLLAQWTNLGVPFLVRSGVLATTFVVAFTAMRDEGFTPEPMKHPLRAMGDILRASIDHGLRHRPVRFIMLAAPFGAGPGMYAFYAAQPHLLRLYEQDHAGEKAYWVAGAAAGLVAATQIAGGWVAPKIRAAFARRTSALVLGAIVSAGVLVVLGLTRSVWVGAGAIAAWGIAFAAEGPIRLAYVNAMIPSKQRATILSFGSLMESSGGVVAQPLLGRSADAYGYGVSFVIAGAVMSLSVPFLLLSRRENAPADSAGTR